VNGNLHRLGVALLVLAACLAACLLFGWLKVLYHYKGFGVDVGLLDLTVSSLLLQSWFVVQNLLYFALLWWVVLKTRLGWTAAVGVLYALVPLGAHYAFAWHDRFAAWWLIDHRHTLLKFVPFAVLGLALLLHAPARRQLRDLSWPYRKSGLALFALIVFSWGISSAKHFGSYDANRAMLRTGQHLSLVRVALRPGTRTELPSSGDELYLLHADRRSLIVWDRAGFVYGHSSELRILVIPRAEAEWFETRRAFEIQPSSQHF
jgi:hypothetical protein